MDDLSALSDLQVRRAKTPRLCWDDGQVRDLCIHSSDPASTHSSVRRPPLTGVLEALCLLIGV